jgi:hypothetical protein
VRLVGVSGPESLGKTAMTCRLRGNVIHEEPLDGGPDRAGLGFHPVDGARYVRQQGQERVASLVAYYSGAQFEAEERGLVDALAEFEPEDGPLLDTLTYADMTTGPAGQGVDLEERIAEILERYAPDDPVHRAVSRSHPVLREAVERTRARLAAPGRPGPLPKRPRLLVRLRPTHPGGPLGAGAGPDPVPPAPNPSSPRTTGNVDAYASKGLYAIKRGERLATRAARPVCHVTRFE